MTRALRRALTPLLRLAVRRGVGLRRIVDITKAALVEIAAQDCAAAGAPATDSRLSVMTGVHRKDVRALRAAETPERPARNLAATVVGRWFGDPAHHGPDGRPRPLRRGDAAGEFDALVASISRDVRPKTVLEELLRLGAARIEADGTVALAEAALAPADDGTALALLAANLGDHAAAAVENLTGPVERPRRLERALFYNRLRPDDVAALAAAARRGGQALLEGLNAEALARQSAAAADSAKDATRRIRIGVYVYDEDEAAAAATRGDDTP